MLVIPEMRMPVTVVVKGEEETWAELYKQQLAEDTRGCAMAFDVELDDDYRKVLEKRGGEWIADKSAALGECALWLKYGFIDELHVTDDASITIMGRHLINTAEECGRRVLFLPSLQSLLQEKIGDEATTSDMGAKE